ncbi:MAG: response regulator [Chlorobi bacterium]|nr:response regulator [Chlorobiota bacterium]
MIQEKKILIVDDSTTNIFLLENLLSAEGYIVYTALTGRDALNLVVKKQPEIVLLDIMMPEMSGYEILKNIIHNMQIKNTKVIMVTAKNSKEDKDKAKQLGAIDYITKPIDSDLILEKIRQHIQ